ncbi:MAG: SDR family oxidoreductase [Planctomycetota bacterium]|jgi:2-deoxy-D-gluconate 3-dehydrogenase|nr:SDR family oxidoreductase [Planctomycetota bacterium]
MVFDDFSLKGKVAVITGGATGIGFGVASGLAEAGASIVCVHQRSDPGAIEKIALDCGGGFLAIQLDISRMENIPVLMEKTIKRFGRVDILVNNAGICPRQSALEYREKTWDDVIQLNQKAVFFLSQAAARRFVEQRTRGKIINIASMLSYLGGFNTAAYTASKHAVMGITRVLASEWGSLGVNVNAIAPGWIATNLSEPLRNDPGRDKAVRARIPQGEWGEPSDFKGVAVLLASAASDYINGVTIPVDGGYLTK